MTQLEEYRQQLDVIDTEITNLFVKRMEIASEIAAYKKANGLPTLDAAREEQVLENHGKAAGPEFSEYTIELFKELMRLSRKYQETKR